MSHVRSALAVASFLPYTMSWIYRQISDSAIGTNLIITQHRENIDLFPFKNIFQLNDDPYWIKAVRAKLWFWFGNRPIGLSFRQTKRLQEVLTNNSIQLVHAHFGTFGIYLLDSCQFLNIPLIVTFHGFDISSALNRWPSYKRSFVCFLSRISFAVVISEEMRQRMVSMGCPEDKIRVSYLGVPTHEFTFVDRSLHDGPVSFLHAGRLTAKKGVADLICAFVRAFPNVELAELLIAGDGEEQLVIENILYEYGNPKNIKILGKVSNQELQNLRTNADVFVLNCRTDAAGTKEGLPIAILEAASTGLPCISTNHAGIPESVIHEYTGLLVDEYDEKGLIEAFLKMMNKDFRLQLGRNARKFMEDRFDIRKCNLRLMEIYKEALEK